MAQKQSSPSKPGLESTAKNPAEPQPEAERMLDAILAHCLPDVHVFRPSATGAGRVGMRGAGRDVLEAPKPKKFF